MAKSLPKKDVVIMGLGWTGAILAQELTDAGLTVVAIERGPWRDTATDFNIGYMPDELRFAVRKELFLQPSQEAMTMRNDASSDRTADAGLRIFPAGFWRWRRRCALERICLALLAQRLRMQKPSDQTLRLQENPRIYRSRIGAFRYDEIEHCLRQVRISLRYLREGRGNLKGQIQPGGNPFEGPRSARISQPAAEDALFLGPVCRSGDGTWDCIPFPHRLANLSRPYVNPLGVRDGPMHLLRLLRALRLRQLFQGQRRRPRSFPC